MHDLLVVLPVGPGDVRIALSTLAWARKLDGVLPDYRAVLVMDKCEPAVLSAAQDLFPTTHLFEVSQCPYEPGWPRPQNWAWQQTARWISDTDGLPPFWFWWEPDAIPLRKGWLDAIRDAHQGGGRPFAGAVVNHPQGQYMAGVGVYPKNAANLLLTAMRIQAHPFDIVGGIVDRGVKEVTDISAILAHRVADNTRNHYFTPNNYEQLVPKGSVMFHPNKDGSLLAMLKGGVKPKKPLAKVVEGRANRFHHSGDLGDVVYSLPTIRELGGGDVFLTPDNRTPMSTREKMNPGRAELLRALLTAQPYIRSVEFCEEMPAVDYDLNQMRMLLRHERLDLTRGFNLARVFLRAFGLPLHHDEEAWLTVPAHRLPDTPVVINRTLRYRDAGFDWKHLLRQCQGRCVFIGTKDEHDDFCRVVGEVPYLPTANLFEAAQIIAGARLFVGNQSCAFAIAEGLKQRAILEACPNGSNTLFPRPTTMVGFTSTSTLPSIDPPPTLATPHLPTQEFRLVMKGPVDGFTGFGQMVSELAIHSAKTVQVQLTAAALNRPIDDRVSPLLLAKVKAPHVRLTCLPVHWIPQHLKAGEVLFTMWESTRLPAPVVEVVNERARAVIVPTTWQETAFSLSGVTRPIHVVPLGHDPEQFAWTPRPLGPFTFGCAGRYVHGGPRKGIESAVSAFQEAFKHREDVRLRVKLHADCTVTFPDDPRIMVTRAFLDWKAMREWYASLDVFLCLSKGEGWGLHAHQAMAVGRPVIATRFSGLSEFHSDATGWVVPHHLVPAVSDLPDPGCWAEPEPPIDLLRYVADHPVQCARRGWLAQAVVMNYTWANVTERLLLVLKGLAK